MMQIKFKPFTKIDFSTIYQWFQEPTINQWYARNKSWTLDDIKNKYSDRILGKENVPSFIIHINDQPIGFIQYYLLSEHLAEGIFNHKNKLFDKISPQDIVGIDLFIAHSENRGKGLGEEIIGCFIDEFLKGHFKAVIVDPDDSNRQAIKCYKKAGFEISNYSEDDKYQILIKRLL